MTNVEGVNNDIPPNMNELCRLCLSKESDILPIFDEENSNNSVPLSFRILACVSIEVSVYFLYSFIFLYDLVCC